MLRCGPGTSKRQCQGPRASSASVGRIRPQASSTKEITHETIHGAPVDGVVWVYDSRAYKLNAPEPEPAPEPALASEPQPQPEPEPAQEPEVKTKSEVQLESEPEREPEPEPGALDL